MTLRIGKCFISRQLSKINTSSIEMIVDGTTPKELLRSESGHVKCELCGALGPSITEHKIGMLSHLAALLVCFSGCSLGCCLIPYCMDTCKDVDHRCSSCRQPLHHYSKI